jgi:hypothetical protein
VSHTPWYDGSMSHERSRVPHRATTAPMDDEWMTTPDYDASTREKRAVRDATTAKARACVHRRRHRANETRTRRERDAKETHLESRGGVDRVLVETVPRVRDDKEAS